MNYPIKVLLADDTLIAREGWKKILTTEGDIEVVGEVTIAQDTLRKVRELRADVLLMDLKWFDDEHAGIGAIAQLKREIPQTKVVAITAYTDLVQGARRAGAEAVLPKGFSKAELVDTIRAVHQLTSFPLLSEALPMAEQLSKREQEVLVLMADGKTDQEIAQRLYISTSTAKNHVRSIMGKLEVSNRAHAVKVGYQRGLLKENDQ